MQALESDSAVVPKGRPVQQGRIGHPAQSSGMTTLSASMYTGMKVRVLWSAGYVVLAPVSGVLLAVAFVGLAGHHVLTTIRPDPNATAGLLVDLIQSVLLVLATLFVPSLWKRVG